MPVYRTAVYMPVTIRVPVRVTAGSPQEAAALVAAAPASFIDAPNSAWQDEFNLGGCEIAEIGEAKTGADWPVEVRP